MVSIDDDTKRRYIMMAGIIVIGTIITFVEMPPVLVIFVTIGAGVFLLFALKMITVSELKEDLGSLKEALKKPSSLKSLIKGKGDDGSKDKGASKSAGKEQKGGGSFFSNLMTKLNQPITLKKGKGGSGGSKADGDGGAKKSMFSGLFAGKKDKEEKTQQIDAMLDKAVSGDISDDEFGDLDDINPEGDDGEGGEVGEGGADAGGEDDEFGDFENMHFGLEGEDEPEPAADGGASAGGGGGGPANFEEEIPDSAIADILAANGIDLDLEEEGGDDAGGDGAPAADSGDAGDAAGTDGAGESLPSEGIGDMEGLDEDVSGLDLDADDDFGELEEMDIDELDDEAIDLGDEVVEEEPEPEPEPEQEPEPEAPPEEDMFAPPKEWSQTKPGELPGGQEGLFEQPVSFGMGGGDEDDLFAMLKSDTKKAVSVQEVSLVRDLKDAHIEAENLVEELQGVYDELGLIIGVEPAKPEIPEETKPEEEPAPEEPPQNEEDINQ